MDRRALLLLVATRCAAARIVKLDTRQTEGGLERACSTRSLTIGWEPNGYGRQNNAVLALLHAVAVSEDSGLTLYVEPAHWIETFLMTAYELEKFLHEYSCARLLAGAKDSIKLSAANAFLLTFPSDVPTHIIEKAGGGKVLDHEKMYREALSYAVVPRHGYRLLYKHTKALHKAECFQTIGHVLNRTTGEIAEAITKSPVLPPHMGYVAIHLRDLEGNCEQWVLPEYKSFCDMPPALFRHIIEKHGAAKMPVVIFGDKSAHSNTVAERLTRIFQNTYIMYNFLGKNSEMHDMLLGMHAAVFIGISASTFSGVIAHTRVALGRAPETNEGILGMP